MAQSNNIKQIDFSVPLAFKPEADKINEIIWWLNALKGMRVKEPLDYSWGTGGSSGPLLSLDAQKLAAMLKAAGFVQAAQASNSGTGLPNSYTFRAFSVCSNGSPITYYWPTWDSDPS